MTFKAPGPDEFQVIFLQTQWSTIGNFITLIPKIDMVTSMKHFRPIGLCNVSYKTITKIISYRLKETLNYLVGPA